MFFFIFYLLNLRKEELRLERLRKEEIEMMKKFKEEEKKREFFFNFFNWFIYQNLLKEQEKKQKWQCKI